MVKHRDMPANSTPLKRVAGVDLTALSIRDAAELIRSGQLCSRSLTQAYLERIRQFNGTLNAFVTITDELAMAQATICDSELQRGLWRGPLHGIPIALKDNIDTAEVLTTAASEHFRERVPTENAEVYRRLRQRGAVLLGKLNMHELAFGGTSAISAFGAVRNPWNLAYIPGGSSGGSGAAVAARLCAAALGTDTLASIRLPAAYCGVVGLKASYGLASLRGIVPLSESLDHVGPLCTTVADAALVLQAIAGFDPRDPVSLRAPVPSLTDSLYFPTQRLKLGIPEAPFYEDLDVEVRQAVTAALEVLARFTAAQRPVALPQIPDFSPLLAEAYAYHQHWLLDASQHRRCSPSTLDNLLNLAAVQTPHYISARRELGLARMAIENVFTGVDLLVTPTTPCMPSTVDHALGAGNARREELSVRNTSPFNVFGIPSISLPCGFSATGLPIGLQISGPRLQEAPVLALAYAFEQATEWHLRRPPI